MYYVGRGKLGRFELTRQAEAKKERFALLYYELSAIPRLDAVEKRAVVNRE